MGFQRKIILASGSPRRKELLDKIGLKFEVAASDYPEAITPGTNPGELVKKIAEGKAKSIAQKYPEAIIIAADTIGVIEGKIIGKPHTSEEAEKMLKLLSGKGHQVITGLTVFDVPNGKTVSRTIETWVYFKQLSDDEIKAYVQTGEPLDKAGAYAIQGMGSVLVKRIEGDYYNVMGLPLNTLAEVLKEMGIKVLG